MTANRSTSTSSHAPSVRKSKRRAAATIAAAGLGVVASEASGAVVHVDPPDIVVPVGSSFWFDVNGDATNEMRLDLTIPLFPGTAVPEVNGELPFLGEIMFVNAASPFWGLDTFVQPLPAGAAIGPSALNWLANYKALLADLNPSGFPATGYFAGVTDKYMGLRFPIGGQMHYGWARLTVAPTGAITLFEWAYQTQENAAMVAGNTVPEPSALVGLAVGAACLLAGRALRKKQQAPRVLTA